MYKKALLIIFLALLTSCSQTKVKKEVKVKRVVEHNKTAVPIATHIENTISEDFVPEHIRLSHIEVVPH